jgi:hypothetical protein
MKRTGIPEIDAINARHDADQGIIHVDDSPYAATMTDAERDQARMVADGTQALSGEMLVSQGEDKGWRFIGGVKFNEPLFIRDADSGMPLVKVTVEVMPGMPAEFHTRVLPALIKRDREGGLLRLTIRFDDSMAYSNQPDAAMMERLVQLGIAKRK